MRFKSPLIAAAALLASTIIASCSDSGPFVPRIETANFAPSLGVDLAASTKLASGVYIRDITVGGGAVVPDTGNKSITTNYVGYLRNGTMFDDGAYTFTTNAGTAIAGYDVGTHGMRVGGQRQIIIPPAMGYGPNRNGSIPPYSILVFNVTLNSINP